MRLKIGSVLDVLVVSEPEHILWLNAHPDVIRPPEDGLTLLHRIVNQRILRDLHFSEGPLPVFRPRDDPERQREQEALAAKLNATQDLDGEQTEALGGYLLDEMDPSKVGPTVQHFCARLFSPRFRVSDKTYAAARLLADWASATPWRTMMNRRSGRLDEAKETVADLCDQDLQAIHGTTIGMENVTQAVHNLHRQATRRGGLRGAPDAAMKAALVVPPVLIRGCERSVQAPFLERPLERYTLVLFLLGKAYRDSGDLDLAFMAGEWNACPARHVVPEFLMNVWEQARDQERARQGGFGRLLRILAA